MRFADYKEGIKQIPRLRNKVLEYFPNILENKYYQKMTKKEQFLYKVTLKMNPTLLSTIKRLTKKVK